MVVDAASVGSSGDMERFLTARVHDSLGQFLYADASFFCERLHAAAPCEANAYLLATCYFRNEQTFRVLHVLKGCVEPRSRYLLGLCCYRMGRLLDAEQALCDPLNGGEVVNGAAGHYLLGLVLKQTDRRTAAAEHFSQALLLDPFMWSAFEALCDLGEGDQAARLLYGPQGVPRADAHCGEGGELQRAAASPATLLPPELSLVYGSSPATPAAGDAFNPFGHHATPHGTPMGTATPAYVVRGAIGMRSDVPTSGAPTGRGGRAGLASAGGVAALSFVDMTPSSAAAASTASDPHEHRSPHVHLSHTSSTTAANASTGPGMHVAATPEGFVTPSPCAGAAAASEASAFPAPFPPTKQPAGAPTRVAAAGATTSTPVARAGERTVSRTRGAKQTDEGKLRKVSGRLFPDSSGRSGGSAVAQGGGDLGGPPRRSSRLSAMATTSERQALEFSGAKPPPPPTSVRPHSAPLSAGRLHHAAEADDDNDDDDNDDGADVDRRGTAERRQLRAGAAAAGRLLRTLSEGYRLLSVYQCREAVDVLRTLPAGQYNTGWVLCMVGRARFEMVDYAEAARAFERARRVDPTRMAGMEVYSTVLWHLKREVELSFLAQEMLALDRLSPQAWLVMGNCFSLQKDHETAIKHITRALQLDPMVAYAHTLCGHEHFANEDFDKAIACFRKATQLDPRHYNAWYGMGVIYNRQEKMDYAESHFRRAVAINGRSSVLQCCLGMACHHHHNQNKEALRILQQAVVNDPRNPLAKYQKAVVLAAEERYEEALAELEELKALAPKEATVFFLMGKIYKKLNLTSQAMMNFSLALDLKPTVTDVNHIKSAIDKLAVPQEETEEEL